MLWHLIWLLQSWYEHKKKSNGWHWNDPYFILKNTMCVPPFFLVFNVFENHLAVGHHRIVLIWIEKVSTCRRSQNVLGSAITDQRGVSGRPATRFNSALSMSHSPIGYHVHALHRAWASWWAAVKLQVLSSMERAFQLFIPQFLTENQDGANCRKANSNSIFEYIKMTIKQNASMNFTFNMHNNKYMKVQILISII